MIDTDNFFSTAILLALLILLVAAVATDLKHHRIPNLLLLPALGFALMLQTMGGGGDGLISSVGGLIVGMAILAPLYVLGGIGAGDVKLLGIVGSLIGPWTVLVAGMATMMAGALFGIIVICWHRVRPTPLVHTSELSGQHGTGLQSTISAAPTLTGNDAVTCIPYAPAIAAGTAAALWYTDNVPANILG